MRDFNYGMAFSRNLGVVSQLEHERLRSSTVAIAGMGGVGGRYLISLIRAGVGGFHIAEFDEFELANFNRQYGANVTTLGRPKVDVMLQYALEINPELRVKVFDKGLNAANMGEFLNGANIVVDGMDVFAIDMHPMLVDAAVKHNLATVAAVPLGLGAGVLVFGPGGMSYQDYFAIKPGMSDEEKIIQFALGFAPEMYHLRYLDPKSIDLKARKGPSSIAGCDLCAAYVSTLVLQGLLYPEELRLLPWYTYLDMRLNRFRHRRLWFGNRNPMQLLKSYVANRRLRQVAGK